MAEKKSIWGKDPSHEAAVGYTGGEEYKKQGDKRTLKFLSFPFLVESPNPVFSGGEPILVERIIYRDETVTTDELGTYALHRGEKLGAFYTDDELEAKKRGATPAQIAAGGETPVFNELGEHELALYIEQNKPTVPETVAMAGDDPETAKRVLAAEGVASGGDPRDGVIKGLNAIISRGNQ